MSNFISNVDFLTKYMSVLTLRHNVISGNIANVETPNYKKGAVSFEAELENAIKQEIASSGDLDMIRTSEKHIDAKEQYSKFYDINPKVVFDKLSRLNNNGNNVNLESEINSGVKNQMLYELVSGIQNFNFRSVYLITKG